MEGNLYKWTNYFSFWKERYFVLRGNILYYYIKKGDRPRGRIHLAVALVNESPEDDTKFEIDTGLAILYLKAETKELKQEWIQAIKKSKVEGNNQDLSKNENFISVDYGTQRNSLGGDDKLIRKISDIRFGVEKLREEHNGNTNRLKSCGEDDMVVTYNVLVYYNNRNILEIYTVKLMICIEHLLSSPKTFIS
jgi:hypothetical protein